jgi:hypothetical protein
MIPDHEDFIGMDFRQLLAWMSGAGGDEVSRLDSNGWILVEERFRDGLLAKWRTLTGDEWLLCGQLARQIYEWAETYSEISRLSVAHRRYHLFTQLLLEAGPRPEVPLTDPARLLREFLDGFPYSIDEAERRLDTVFDELHEPMLPMAQMRRVEHLFPASAELDEYRAWQDLWARVTGVPESERAPWPRGGKSQ